MLVRSPLRLLFLMAVVLCVIVVSVIYERRAFDEFIPVTLTQPESGDVPGVCVIGDSWVDGGEMGRALEGRFEYLGVSVIVASAGQAGANSRQIYRNLIGVENERDPVNKQFGAPLKYCVVVAGINDTAGHIGADFYAHHVSVIIKVLQYNNIIPVVLEIPRYGVEKVRPRCFLTGIKRFLFRYMFDAGILDNVDKYRSVLTDYLKSQSITGVVIVNPDSTIFSYEISGSLFSDPAHLNADGYAALAGLLADTINDHEI